MQTISACHCATKLRPPLLDRLVSPWSRWGCENLTRDVLTSSSAVGLVVALGLAGLAYWQREIAIEQRAIAEGRRVAVLGEAGFGKDNLL
jgi:hypothetical protein